MNNIQLRENRKRYKMTQQDLADELGIDRRTVINYEKGEPIPHSKIKLLEHIFSEKEKLYDISNAQPLVVKDPQELYANKNGNVFFEEDGKLYVSVKLVPVKAFGSYLSDFQDPDFFDSLHETRKFKVDHMGRGNYICFEVKGDSMNGGKIDDSKDGAELLCRELGRQHWKDGFRDSPLGWVIVHRDTIVFKDIKSVDMNTGDMVLSSRSGLPQHPDFTVNLNDVRQIWRVIKRTQD